MIDTSDIYLRLDSINAADDDRGLVPSRHYIICRAVDDEPVGECSLRLGHNGKDGYYSTYYGGNIGYEVYPDFRGNRYAAKATLVLLDEAKTLGMEYVLITCSPENLASKRTIELAGFALVEDTEVPEHNCLYERGECRKLIYKMDLK